MNEKAVEEPATMATINTIPNSSTTHVDSLVPGTRPDKEAEQRSPSPISRSMQVLANALPALMSSTSHTEIWGIELAPSSIATHIPTQIILQKYLNANEGDVAAATAQLRKTLAWRAKMQPVHLVEFRRFFNASFCSIGVTTTYVKDVPRNPACENNDEYLLWEGRWKQTNDPKNWSVFTYTVYGKIKDVEATFGDLDEFIKWRVALMEVAIDGMDIMFATEPIPAWDDPDGREDPFKIVQVHDYEGVSFLGQSASARAAAKETVRLFGEVYPETLKEKFFVNVPSFMGFVYGLMKPFIAPKTLKRMHPMSNGAALSKEFVDEPWLVAELPEKYGGDGRSLHEHLLMFGGIVKDYAGVRDGTIKRRR